VTTEIKCACCGLPYTEHAPERPAICRRCYVAATDLAGTPERTRWLYDECESPECGKLLPSEALACPHCLTPTSRRPSFLAPPITREES
jgi:hypothetical protein